MTGSEQQYAAFSCPACSGPVLATQARCACGADLSVLMAIEVATDSWYNAGLLAATEGRLGEALEWLSAVCVARPSDVDALCAQGEAWVLLGHAAEAERALARAEAVNPSAPALEELRRVLSGDIVGRANGLADRLA